MPLPLIPITAFLGAPQRACRYSGEGIWRASPSSLPLSELKDTEGFSFSLLREALLGARVTPCLEPSGAAKWVRQLCRGVAGAAPLLSSPAAPGAAHGAAPRPAGTRSPTIRKDAAALRWSALSPAPAVSKIAWDQVVRANFSRSRGCR